MTDEISLTRDTTRGARAKALLEDELLKECFATLEKAYIDKWRTTDALDAPAREKLFIAVNVIGKVRENLGFVLSNGNLAQKELDRLTAEKKRGFFRAA